MKGIDIYNKKVRRSPLDGSVPFVDTGFDTRNIYNLMAAIKLDYEKPIEKYCVPDRNISRNVNSF